MNKATFAALQNDARSCIEVAAMDYVQDAAILQLHTGLDSRLVPLDEIGICCLHLALVSLHSRFAALFYPEV